MKRHSFALLLTLISAVSFAQTKFNVTGAIIEKGSNQAIPSASVRVLSLPDSSLVTGASTSLDGSFKIQNVKKGKYALKVTFIGYQDHTISLDLTNQKDKTVNVGYLTLVENSKMLKDAVVAANVAQVQVSGDSIVYNASAFRTAEGSMLEDLVKKLPGAQIDNDGKITINGKEVKKIMVDGKEFFLNDTQTALKNIPTNIIDRIKTYDRKSDLSRVTGIDDGEEETVLDLQVKKGMNQGWFGNIDGGIGTNHRYSERLMLNRFNDNSQYTLIGGANNTGDMGFGGGGGRGGWGRGGSGLRASKNVGFNYATTSDKLETGGSIRYRYNGSDTYSDSYKQDIKSNVFTKSISQSYGSNHNVDFQYRLEWKPDSMTNIIFRPSANYSLTRSMSKSKSAEFGEDPYENPVIASDPLVVASDSIFSDLEAYKLIKNTQRSNSQDYSLSKGINGELQINRRLNNEGRNITFRATGGYSDKKSKNINVSDTKTKQEEEDENKVKTGNILKESTTTNRYKYTPETNFNYSLMLTYSEPIAHKTYLQFSYQFNYTYRKSDQQASVWDASLYREIEDIISQYRYNVTAIYDEILSRKLEPNNTPELKSQAEMLEQYSEHKTLEHRASISFRKVGDAYNFSVGMDFIPQHTTLNYKSMGKEYPNVKRDVFNFAPNLDYRYQFTKQRQLRMSYRGRTSQPSMEDLLEITDSISNPLAVSKGNSGLKPSLTHRFNFNFNDFNMDLQQSIFAFGNFSFTQNDVTTRTTILNEKTNKKMTSRENTNGNWNAMLGFGFNRGLGAQKLFTVNSFTMANYNNRVSLYTYENGTDEKSNTGTLGINERLSFSFRKDWFEMSVNGNINYNNTRSNGMNAQNRETFDFSYGAEMNIYFNFGLSLSTDISESSKRGYGSSDLNTNELLWNAQLSQSFLKGKALTVSLQWNDILQKQSNISRAIAANTITDSRTNAIYSYGMIHVIYKLNIFGGKNSNGTANAKSMFDFRPGNFGGGRPGGNGGGGRPAGGGRRM